MSEYVNIKIPKELSDEIDKVVTLKLKGYRNRGEFTISAIREFLKDFEDELKPRFKHFNCYDEHVTLWDNLKKRLIDIHFREFKPYIYCELCESSNCDHIKFVLTIPKVIETLKKRGWNIEEGKIIYVPP